MLQVRPLHPLFAGEVTGVDLRRPLPDADIAAIREAFERLSVLVFPDQDLDDEAQIAFSRLLGPLEATRAGAAGAGSPTIVLSNVGPDGAIAPPTDKQALNNRANRHWHHDSSFKPVPARASLLHAREIPGAGGNTEFASTRAAWATLPPCRRSCSGKPGAAWRCTTSAGRVPASRPNWSRNRSTPIGRRCAKPWCWTGARTASPSTSAPTPGASRAWRTRAAP